MLGWQYSFDSDGLVAESNRLLVGVGNHSVGDYKTCRRSPPYIMARSNTVDSSWTKDCNLLEQLAAHGLPLLQSHSHYKLR